MAHHNHHHQLTAHSQLTTLSPGQIHYIQLPAASIIPANTAIYHHENRVVPANFLRIAPGITTEGGGNCLICVQSLPTRMIRNGSKKSVEIFEKVCQLLQVPIVEIQHEWDFVLDDKLPFCLTCTELIQGLIILDEQLQVIQRQLNESLCNVRRTIQETADRVPVNDGKTLNFRSRVLKYGHLTTVAASRNKSIGNIQENGQYDGVVAGNIVAPDMINLATPISNLVIQPEASFQNVLSTASTTMSSQPLQYSLMTPFHPSSAQKPTTFPLTQVAFNTTPTLNSASNMLLSPNRMYIQQASSSTDNFEGSDSYFDNGIDFQSQSDSESSFESSNNESFEDVILPKNTLKRAAAVAPRKRTKNTLKSTDPKFKANTNPKRQSNEYFAPVETDEQGQTVFEGIIIKLGESGYVCGQCGATCGKGHDKASMRKIKIHIKGFHLGAYTCNVCDKNFTSNDILSQHITRTHQVADVPCDICLRPVKPRYMESHKFTHMNAEEKATCIAAGFKPPIQSKELECRFECTTCGKMFKKRTVLRRHEASHLSVELRKHYKCGACNRAYTTDQALKEHVLTHHDEVGNARKKMCKVCGKVMFAKALQKHLKTHVAKEDRPYICKICGARLGNAKSLQMHEAAHDPNESPGTFSAECDVCGKMFKSLVSMRNHRRKTHRNHWKLVIPPNLMNDVSIDKPGEDGYLDDLNNEGLQHVEGQLFSYQLYHLKRIQEPSNGYCCCTCQKEFTGDDDEVEEKVKTHIRSEHIGNFRCNICTKRMKNIEEVLAHKRSDHMHSVGLDCEICKKPNISLKAYKSHIWMHKNPHEIADSINAGESFPHNYVNEHQTMLVELGVQLSFSCAICKAKLGKVEHLYEHRLVLHPDAPKLRIKRKIIENKRGRKAVYSSDPCECPECGKRFTKGRGMTRHLREKHDIFTVEQGSKSKTGTSKQAVKKARREKVNIKKEILPSSDSDAETSDFDDDDGVEYRNSNQSDDDAQFKLSAAQVGSPGVLLRRSQRNHNRIVRKQKIDK